MEQYLHLLIARSDRFVPTPSQLKSFLIAMISKGVVPELEAITFRTPSERVRTGTNPFTGETVTIPMWDNQDFRKVDEVEAAAKSVPDYQIQVIGRGLPKMPPIPVVCDDPYYVSIHCRINSELKSTSDCPEDSGAPLDLAQYGKPIAESPDCGYFIDPSGNLIKVADAGSARFWIEFELGRWLFPEMKDGNLDILHPEIVRIAEQTFETEFVQGCTYY